MSKMQFAAYITDIYFALGGGEHDQGRGPEVTLLLIPSTCETADEINKKLIDLMRDKVVVTIEG